MTKSNTTLTDEQNERFDEKFQDGEDPLGLGITSIISKTGKPQKVHFKGSNEELEMQGFNDAKVSEIKQWAADEISRAVKEEHKKCRKVYVEGCDWSEWAISDEEASENFDIEYKLLTPPQKE